MDRRQHVQLRAADVSTYNGTSYSYNNVAKLMKQVGVTKPAVLAFASLSAALSAKQLVADDSALGLKNCYLNTSVPFGASDFTAIVLQIKQQGCDGAVGRLRPRQTWPGIGLADAGLTR